MGCSGIAGAVFSPVVSSIIGAAGWRTGFAVIAVLSVVLNLPAILFLPSLDPSSKGLRALGAPNDPAARGETSVEKAMHEKTPIQPLLFVAVIAFAFFASALTALPQHFPGMAQSYALDAVVGASMISICMVINTVGKVVLGVLVDRFGARASVLLYSALIGGALAMLLLVHVPQILLVAAGLYGCCYGIAAVGNTMVTCDAFGLGNYSRTYPVVRLVGNVANAVFSSAVEFMYDFSGGYTSTLIMLAVMTVAMAGAVVFVYRQPRSA